MIQFLYVLFFLALNVFIYLTLNKLLTISSYVNAVIVLLFVIVVFIHQLNLFNHQMSALVFWQLCIFSFTLIGWFFLNKFLIKRIDKKHDLNSFNNLIAIMIKRGIFINILFVMTTISQIFSIIDMK